MYLVVSEISNNVIASVKGLVHFAARIIILSTIVYYRCWRQAKPINSVEKVVALYLPSSLSDLANFNSCLRHRVSCCLLLNLRVLSAVEPILRLVECIFIQA